MVENIEWRLIPDTRYEVSENGDVRHVERRHVLRPFLARGYPIVGLSVQGPRGTKTFHVHRIVARAFLGPKPEGMAINHKDGNKQNNHYSNLEYITNAENESHAVRFRLKASGERHGQSKLTVEAVKDIRIAREAGATYAALARKYSVDPATIRNVVQGIYWSHVH